MANRPQDVCALGRHSLNDPRNTGHKIYGNGFRQRYCLPCSIASRRAKPLPRLIRPPTVHQLSVMQDRANGMTDTEIAQRDNVTPDAVRKAMQRVRYTLGIAPSTAAAVAVLLAYELIKPDTAGPVPPRNVHTAPYALSVLDLVQGRRGPYQPLDVQRARLLDVLYAWTEPHAVSVLWAAGMIVPRDVAPLFAKEK